MQNQSDLNKSSQKEMTYFEYVNQQKKLQQQDNQNPPLEQIRNDYNAYYYIPQQQHSIQEVKEDNNEILQQEDEILQQEDDILQFNDMADWISKQKKLNQIQLKKVVDFETFQEIIQNYATHDSSIPEISFHFNPDGSQAILFNIFCNKITFEKNINQRDDFLELLYDDVSMHAMVLIGKKLDLNNYDQNFQNYQSNQLPLSVFISWKFDEQKKMFNSNYLTKKKQLLYYSGIKNQRFRKDLMEMFQCLNEDLEFVDSFASDHYFIYYTQLNNMYVLEALIIGPQDSPYEGIPYTLTVIIPEQYPQKPPKITFNQQILHPNISDEGKICLDILQDNWSPALTLQKLLLSIVSLLYEKNLDDVYNHYAKRLYIEDPEELKKLIRQQAVQSGCQNISINYQELEEKTQLQRMNKNE